MFKGSYLFQPIILGIHVSFRGCKQSTKGQPVWWCESNLSWNFRAKITSRELANISGLGKRHSQRFPGCDKNLNKNAGVVPYCCLISRHSSGMAPRDFFLKKLFVSYINYEKHLCEFSLEISNVKRLICSYDFEKINQMFFQSVHMWRRLGLHYKFFASNWKEGQPTFSLGRFPRGFSPKKPKIISPLQWDETNLTF